MTEIDSKKVIRRVKVGIAALAAVVGVMIAFPSTAATNDELAQHAATIQAEREVVKRHVQCYVQASYLGFDSAMAHAKVIQQYTTAHIGLIDYYSGYVRGYLEGSGAGRLVLIAKHVAYCSPEA